MARPYHRDCVENFVQKAHSIRQTAPVAIFAMIAAVTQELVYEIPVCSVHFNSIKSRLFCEIGGILKMLDNQRNFICL